MRLINLIFGKFNATIRKIISHNPVIMYKKIPFIEITALLILLSLCAIASATGLPKSNAVPGGIAIIPLDVNSDEPPVVLYDNNRVLVAQASASKSKWTAVVGIPLETKTGKHEITVKTGDAQSKVSFTVKKKKYKTQYLTLKNKRKVNPTKEDLERIGEEKKLTMEALAVWRETPEVNTKFVIPVKGKLSSPFGLKRFFNNEPRKPHSGIDIAAPEGTPIVSPAAGVVISTGNYFFNGNTIFIDHGQGLITMYCHMSEISVQPGQRLSQGEKIGAIGKTGRATGPHLHWSISLNDARVDPGLFFDNLKKVAQNK